jgi:hypothetical protein
MASLLSPVLGAFHQPEPKTSVPLEAERLLTEGVDV